MTVKEIVEQKARAAKAASRQLATVPVGVKNAALYAMAEQMENTDAAQILAANEADVASARAKNVKASYIDRLTLTKERLHGIAKGLRQTAALPDPLSESDFSVVRPNGLSIRRVRVPLGVIGIIYEARPNVTADAAALCLKAGNACLLRGGSEALKSNAAIVEALTKAAASAGLPAGAIGFIDVTDREAVGVMGNLRGIVDVIIPRGGAGLIKYCAENCRVPVIETGTGVCHTFVDETADLTMAVNIAVNAKTSRPSVCNAMETLLVHERIAPAFLPLVTYAMKAKQVELRGCEKCLALDGVNFVPATEEDWATEYGDLILAVKIVPDVTAAIEHINRYNTGHSETIVTDSVQNAEKFRREVDAAAVYVNASTRFTDGFEFGFGAEIGISTQKLHARGPMGLRELTSVKYLIDGQGQCRQ